MTLEKVITNDLMEITADGHVPETVAAYQAKLNRP